MWKRDPEIGSEEDIRNYTRYMLVNAIRVSIREIVETYLAYRACDELGGQKLGALVVTKDVNMELGSLTAKGWIQIVKEGEEEFYVLNRPGRVNLAGQVYGACAKSSEPTWRWRGHVEGPVAGPRP